MLKIIFILFCSLTLNACAIRESIQTNSSPKKLKGKGYVAFISLNPNFLSGLRVQKQNSSTRRRIIFPNDGVPLVISELETGSYCIIGFRERNQNNYIYNLQKNNFYCFDVIENELSYIGHIGIYVGSFIKVTMNHNSYISLLKKHQPEFYNQFIKEN